MRARHVLWVIWLGAACSGCETLAEGFRNTVIESVAFNRDLADCIDMKRARSAGEIAWQETLRNHPELTFSPDHSWALKITLR